MNKPYSYILSIHDPDTGEQIFTIDTFSSQRVIEELGRFERLEEAGHFLETIEDAKAEPDTLIPDDGQ